MNAWPPGGTPVPDVVGLVATEVERQINVLREDVEGRLAALSKRTVDDRAALIVFSCDLDKVLAGFVVATGAAAAGLETSMFFTFWGLSVLKKKGGPGASKGLLERAIALMSPGSSESLGTSRLNLLGLGPVMLRKLMRDKRVASLEDLMQVARDLGVKMIACTMSMDVMGISKEELVDGLEYGGVATYMADAARARVSLFI
jgi:peroxiredoxin family protein